MPHALAGTDFQFVLQYTEKRPEKIHHQGIAGGQPGLVFAIHEGHEQQRPLAAGLGRGLDTGDTGLQLFIVVNEGDNGFRVGQ